MFRVFFLLTRPLLAAKSVDVSGKFMLKPSYQNKLYNLSDIKFTTQDHVFFFCCLMYRFPHQAFQGWGVLDRKRALIKNCQQKVRWKLDGGMNENDKNQPKVYKMIERDS